jgi:hypothetical protein
VCHMLTLQKMADVLMTDVNRFGSREHPMSVVNAVAFDLPIHRLHLCPLECVS